MTVLFIGRFGTFPDDVVARCVAAARDAKVPIFDIVLDTVGSFQNHEHPWWLGCSDTPDSLVALRNRLSTRSPACEEIPFVPHVTIARDGGVFPSIARPPDSIVWRAREFSLAASVAGESEFRILGSWPFGEH